VREPLVDVFDEPGEVLVTAELPGVGADEVTATVERDRLRIETTGRQRFRKHVALPCNLDSVTPVIRLSNGILEIRLQKPTEPAAS
jgi:HSP20 family protein